MRLGWAFAGSGETPGRHRYPGDGGEHRSAAPAGAGAPARGTPGAGWSDCWDYWWVGSLMGDLLVGFKPGKGEGWPRHPLCGTRGTWAPLVSTKTV